MDTINFKTRLYVLNMENINYEEDYEFLYSSASEDRKAKADRIKCDRDKLRCLCAFHLLVFGINELIKEYPLLHNSWEATQIATQIAAQISIGPKGKPYFKDVPICFNLSHSGERVILAVSTKEVGCDVECKEDKNLSVAKRFFAKEEYDYLCENDDFTGIWTLKESVIKACGEGMSYSLKDFCVIKDKKISNSIRLSIDGEEYYLKRFPKDGEYEYSICSLDPEFEENYIKVCYNRTDKIFEIN